MRARQLQHELDATIEAVRHVRIAILMRSAHIARSRITWALDAGCDIAATPSVDGYVSPGDLSVDMGVLGQWDVPVMVSAMRAAKACRKPSKIAACHTKPIEAMPSLGMIKKPADALCSAFRAHCGTPR